MLLDKLPQLGTEPSGRRTGTVRLDAELQVPFAIIETGLPGPRLLISAGVHGAEFGAVASASDLISDPPQLDRGSLLILPVLNVRGFYARAPFVMPEDGRNLNHVFPGLPDGSASQRLAFWLDQHVFPQVDAYIDLHNGDIVEDLVPFTIFPAANQASRELAATFALGLSLASPGSGFAIEAASRHGIPAIIAETSGNGLWSADDVQLMRSGILRVLGSLGMYDGPTDAPSGQENLIEKWDPKAPESGLWYPAKKLLDTVVEGDTLGAIRNIFGDVLHTITAERAGFVLYRLSSLSVNRGDALMGVAYPWHA